MSNLSKYTTQPMSDLYEKLGIFFAFSNEQYKQGAVEGVKYATSSGMFVPKSNVDQYIEESENIRKNGLEQLKRDHTDEQIIIYELRNHESFYTGELDDALDVLSEYGYSYDDVNAVYKQHR